MLKPDGVEGRAEKMRTSHKSKHPFAVVAGLDLNGLGVVRSLAAENLPILVLDTDFLKPTATTRFGRKLTVPALSGPMFVDALRKIAANLQDKPVLFLTQEGSVETVAAHQDDLSAFYRLTMPSQGVMKSLLNKSGF